MYGLFRWAVYKYLILFIKFDHQFIHKEADHMYHVQSGIPVRKVRFYSNVFDRWPKFSLLWKSILKMSSWTWLNDNNVLNRVLDMVGWQILKELKGNLSCLLKTSWDFIKVIGSTMIWYRLQKKSLLLWEILYSFDPSKSLDVKINVINNVTIIKHFSYKINLPV